MDKLNHIVPRFKTHVALCGANIEQYQPYKLLEKDYSLYQLYGTFDPGPDCLKCNNALPLFKLSYMRL